MNLERTYIQKRFADQLSLRLPQFTLKSYAPYQANFRCDICGDSATNKYKKRGFLLESEKGLTYYCHNGCGTMSFDSYLKNYHGDLHSQYVFDLLRQKRDDSPRPTPRVEEKKEDLGVDVLELLPRLSDLPEEHRAFKYMRARQVPEKFFSEIFWVPKFYTYINAYLPNKFKDDVVENYEHGRIILPLRHTDGRCFGVIGRSIDGYSIRYITIKFEDSMKIYGLERLDKSKHAYIVEGPIDSFFLPNCIALAGTDGDIDQIIPDKDSRTIILDNQPRNKEVILKYSKYISNGSRICIWPDHIQSKDINDMVLEGTQPSEILTTIRDCSYSGLNAEIRFKNWKKI